MPAMTINYHWSMSSARSISRIMCFWVVVWQQKVKIHCERRKAPPYTHTHTHTLTAWKIFISEGKTMKTKMIKLTWKQLTWQFEYHNLTSILKFQVLKWFVLEMNTAKFNNAATCSLHSYKKIYFSSHSVRYKTL